ncbi:hypothetical protein V1514DRAFT_355111 [Lipomyces japonicus]|uniref:uncharacterized protein n=1 Tax=Lipomyces japonicus TaxID=56871 RepID=UPI0034CE6DBC
MELQSADDIRTVLATPLAVKSLNLSLTARRLATTTEMARLQVLHLRDVPLLLTPEVALATFGPSVAPFGEIVELQRDINPRYPLVHNGKYRLVVRLADAFSRPFRFALIPRPTSGAAISATPRYMLVITVPLRLSAARTTSTSSATVIGDPPTPTESCSATSEPGTPPDQTALPSATVPTVRAPSPVKIPRPTRKLPVRLPPDTTPTTSARSPTRGRSTVPKRQASRTPPPGPPPSSALPRRRASASPHKLVRINATLPPVVDFPGEEPNQPSWRSPERVEDWFLFFQRSVSHVFCVSETFTFSPELRSYVYDTWVAINPEGGAIVAAHTAGYLMEKSPSL